MVVQDKPRLSFEDFLASEAKAEFRSEYHDGERVLMPGGTFNHNRIARNFVSEFNTDSKGQPYEIFINDVVLWLPLYHKSTYPDLMIVVGEVETLPERQNVILNPSVIIENPSVIIEVLSDSTEAYDRGDKFKLYRSLASFREYILVSQNVTHVDQFVQTEGGQWLLSYYDGESAVLKLKTVAFEITLKDLYDKVVLDNS
jgi:Uma2 family endonuclease